MKQEKKTDCYAAFSDTMKLIQKETAHLTKLLETSRPLQSYTTPQISNHIPESLSLEKELLQNTLFSFITPLERKDIVRLMNALTMLLNSLCEASHGLPYCSSRFVSAFSIYRQPLSDCSSLLMEILQKLPEKKQLTILLSKNEALSRYLLSAKTAHISCLHALLECSLDSRQALATYHMHCCFQNIFTHYEHCAMVLEEIFCDL